MGFGLHAIKLMHLVKNARILKPDFTVIELGNQDFVPAVAAAQALICDEFGFSGADAISYPGELYARLGSPRYETIDISGERGAHPFDLNQNLSSYGFGTKFDFVTNFGMTNLLFDQKTLFRNIHELTVAGGTMVHSVPAQGFQNRGLFSYNPAFFLYLAAANEYQLMGIFVAVDDELFSYDEALLSTNRILARTNVQLVTVLLKNVEMPFVDPHDRAASAGYRDFKPDLVTGSPFWPFPLNEQFQQNIQVSMKARPQ